MTPDMKRLCEAAEDAFLANIIPASDDNELRETLDAVVRAVLMAMREPEGEALAAGSVDFLRDVIDPWDSMPAQMDEAFGLPAEGPDVWAPAEERIRPRVQRSFTAMIDHILADPVKA